MSKKWWIILIAGLFVELLVVYSLGGLSGWFSGSASPAQQARCEADFKQFARELEGVKEQTDSFPTHEEWLQKTYEAVAPPPSFSLNSSLQIQGMAYYHEAPSDPWGMPYQYACPSSKKGRDYDLYSLGPDKVVSDDDIYYEPAEK